MNNYTKAFQIFSCCAVYINSQVYVSLFENCIDRNLLLKTNCNYFFRTLRNKTAYFSITSWFLEGYFFRNWKPKDLLKLDLRDYSVKVG